jgi:hypothetical protein
VSLELHLRRPRSSELGDALRGCGQVSLEIHLQSMIERDWRCMWRRSIWRQSMGGTPGAYETLFISYLTRILENVTR